MNTQQILVAEDDHAISDVVKLLLENEGYDILMSDNEDEVYKLLAENHPSVILLDIWLDGSDGGKIARKLKSQSRTKNIPVIMMSANNETEKITKASGADDFLLKPFNIDDLLHMVKKYSVL
jgi:DNA-binding response OmpR family regulator